MHTWIRLLTRINPSAGAKVPMTSLTVRLDHLVYACSDLAAGVERIAGEVGMTPVEGGRHPVWGTRNALLGLRGGAYLEVVAPDPTVPAPAGGRGLGVERAGPGRLVTWAVRSETLPADVSAWAALGIEAGPVVEGSRRAADGTLLEWILTDPAADRLSGVLPFMIDWGESRHPSDTLAASGHVAGSVERLRLRHPRPDLVRAALEAIGVPPGPGATLVEIERGPASVRAILETPRGVVELE